MPRLVDLTGHKFNRLTVLERADDYISPKGYKATKWVCECTCGKITEVRSCDLRGGKTQSCRCYNDEIVKEVNKTLGMSKERVYNIWQHMRRRCDDRNFPQYQDYGGRGITYDEKWSKFEGFYEDMAEGYSDTLTLDRRDPNKGYYKSNCRWLERKYQNRNQRIRKANRSGKTGVNTYSYKGEDKGYVAYWRDLGGSHRSKYFTFSKYGEEEAFRLACEYRDEQIRLLNEQGAGYTEGHGK